MPLGKLLLIQWGILWISWRGRESIQPRILSPRVGRGNSRERGAWIWSWFPAWKSDSKEQTGKERDIFYMGGKGGGFSVGKNCKKPRLGRTWRSRHHPWLSISLAMEKFLFSTPQAVWKIFPACVLAGYSSIGITSVNSDLYWQCCNLSPAMLYRLGETFEDSLSK